MAKPKIIRVTEDLHGNHKYYFADDSEMVWLAGHDGPLCDERMVEWDGPIAPDYTEEELLAHLKEMKRREIQQAADAEEVQPVEVGGHQYIGGKSSSQSLKGQLDLYAHAAKFDASVTHVPFFTVDGYTTQVPIDSDTEVDAMDVCTAVGMAYSALVFKRLQYDQQITAATTPEEVREIKWQ